MGEEPRSTRRRWWPVAAAAAIVVLAAGAWVVIDLVGSGGFGGCVDITEPESYKVSKADDAAPVAISSDGRYLVGAAGGEGSGEFTLWHDDEPQPVTVDIGADETVTVMDVNDSGVVVGTVETPEGNMSTHHAWRYENGEFTNLTLAGGFDEIEVAALNNDGTAVGSAFRHDAEPDAAAVKWEAGKEKGTKLSRAGGPEDESLRPADISDDGVVVGTFGYDAWIWPSQGDGRKLSPQPAEGYEGSPTITGDRVAAGNLLWDSTEGDDHKKIGVESLRLNTIDDCGRAYGSSNGVHGKAIVTDGGKPRELPQLKEPVYEEYPEEPEFPLGEVTGASADGSILIGESNGWPAVWRYE